MRADVGQGATPASVHGINWPLPLEDRDELILGHMGRMRRWCAAPSRTKMLELLRARAPEAKGRRFSWHEAVAAECGLRASQYVQRHSMLAYTCFLVEDRTAHWEVAPTWTGTVIEKEGAATPDGRAAFCHSCVNEDMARQRFSVWRRRHQLPTSFRCAVHDEALCYAEDRSALMADPSEILRSGAWRRAPEHADWQNSDAIKKMDLMAAAMLASCRSWPHSTVTAQLKRRAAVKGLQISKHDGAALLSAVARESFPLSFLQTLFPSFIQQSSTKKMGSVDNVICGGNSPTPLAVALALSVLYASPTEAFEDFRQAEVQQTAFRHRG